MSDIRAILTDIEGTTSSIDFVKDVLFPYARKHLPAYVETHTDEAEVQHWLHEAAKEAGIVEATRGEIIDLLIRWIDEDRKSTALKALQGMIWREGYESGAYVSHMYPEVAARLRAWHDAGHEALRLLLGLGAGAEAAVRLQRERRPHATVLRLLRYTDRAQARDGVVPPHRGDDRLGRRRRSCSCPISVKNWTPPAKPACVPRSSSVRPRPSATTAILQSPTSMPSLLDPRRRTAIYVLASFAAGALLTVGVAALRPRAADGPA